MSRRSGKRGDGLAALVRLRRLDRAEARRALAHAIAASDRAAVARAAAEAALSAEAGAALGAGQAGAGQAGAGQAGAGQAGDVLAAAAFAAWLPRGQAQCAQRAAEVSRTAAEEDTARAAMAETQGTLRAAEAVLAARRRALLLRQARRVQAEADDRAQHRYGAGEAAVSDPDRAEG
ncbi:MAG: hypothetical protein IT557_13305 [Alphaproteobacteria bacterium]|nr:hypothetical protein [Alphaproteobacteria bacterium]